MSIQKVLLVAYQCAPNMGSVSQIGWEWYRRLCEQHQVTLVTHIRNQQALTDAGVPLPNSQVHYIDTEWFAKPLYRLAKQLFPRSEHSVFLLSSLDYFIFDWGAYRQLQRRLKQGETWQILHRTTPVTLSAPTWLTRLGLPCVIGPLNSGLEKPANFDHIMQQESSWLFKSRSLSHILDALIGSSKRIDRLLVATQATMQVAGKRLQQRCSLMLENGVDLNRFTAQAWPEAPSFHNPLRILFVGRLIPVKALDLLMQAVVLLSKGNISCELHIAGDGPMRHDWQQLSQQLGLASQVIFHGAVSHEQLVHHYKYCHVFCLPSVRESGGAVLLEAMACARPVIALDFGGPSEIVHAGIGALLPMSYPKQVIYDLARALADIPKKPEYWRQLGLNGRDEVEKKYSWAAKVASIDHVYDEVVLHHHKI